MPARYSAISWKAWLERPVAQQNRIEQEMGRIESRGPILLKKDKKITPTCSPCLRFIAIL
jgi:hypothetical protein